MKTTAYKAYRTTERIPYPNAATRREVLQKILDTALVAACGMGIAAMVLLALVLQ